MNDKVNEDIIKRLPLVSGDIIYFESGRSYEVGHSRGIGLGQKNKYYLNDLSSLKIPGRIGKKENLRFSSLRELNYEIEKQIHLITKIIKTEFAIYQEKLNIDESHRLAIQENINRDSILNFLKNLNKDTI